MKSMLLFLLSLHLAAPAIAHPFLHDTVVGGSRVEPGEAIAAHTVYVSNGVSRCTGVLIAADVVLSAGHCFKRNPETRDVRVFFGVRDGDDGSSGVRAYGVHPRFSPKNRGGGRGSHWDMSVIILNKAPPKGYRAAPILSGVSSLPGGTAVIAAGFGRSIARDPDSSGRLRKATIRVIEMLNENELVHDSSEGQSTCGGDSGGPSFLNKNGVLHLVGIISRGDDDCRIDETHSFVPAYQTWIDSEIRALRSNER